MNAWKTIWIYQKIVYSVLVTEHLCEPLTRDNAIAVARSYFGSNHIPADLMMISAEMASIPNLLTFIIDMNKKEENRKHIVL